MLIIPKDVDFEVPTKSDKEFFNPKEKEEDETLLATGAWDNEPEDDDEANEEK